MYAKTQSQRKGRGQAVALGLVRAVLHGANLLSAMRHNEAVRARLSEDFGVQVDHAALSNSYSGCGGRFGVVVLHRLASSNASWRP